MRLRLTIENVPSLPDGGPISYTVTGKRGFDIGRDQYLDWVLPDPNRVVSGKHCEIRYRDGDYWLRDVSTNGTFVNHSERRLQDQHRLTTGDRIEIGHYIINVEVEGEGVGAEDGASDQPAEPGLWGAGPGAAAPVDPRSLRAPNIAQPVQSFDPLDWVATAPEPLQSFQPPPAPPPAQAAPAPFAPPAEDIWGAAPSSGPAAPSAWGDRPSPPAPEAPPVSAPPVEPLPPAQSAPPPPPDAEVRLPRATPPDFEAPRAPAYEPAPPPPAYEPPPRAPQAPPSLPRAAGASDAEFIRRFAKGAGLPEDAIATRDAGQLAELLGVLMSISAANLGQLLAARAESKGAMRSANQTLVQAADNNPLRFSPTAEDALSVMFGRPTKSYLDARRAFEQSFLALKAHQVDSFAAIQSAIQKLVADLDPAEIEKALDAGKGGSLFANKKARLWDDFVTRWKMKTGGHETGLLGAFMQHFGEAYDRRRR